MTKICVCDKCKNDGKLVETIKFMKVPKHPELRLDLCDNCMKEVRKLDIRDYVKLVYKLTANIDLNKDEGMCKLIFAQLNL